MEIKDIELFHIINSIKLGKSIQNFYKNTGKRINFSFRDQVIIILNREVERSEELMAAIAEMARRTEAEEIREIVDKGARI